MTGTGRAARAVRPVALAGAAVAGGPVWGKGAATAIRTALDRSGPEPAGRGEGQAQRIKRITAATKRAIQSQSQPPRRFCSVSDTTPPRSCPRAAQGERMQGRFRPPQRYVAAS
jgi:hypothetical protein